MTATHRGLHLAAMLSLLGTTGFMALLLPAASLRHDGLERRLVRLWRLSGVVAVIAGLAWLVREAGAIAAAGDVSELASALPVVATQTRFGQVLIVRLALLVLATLLAGAGRPRQLLGMLVASAAAILEGLIGHAGAAGGLVGNGLVVSEAFHLLAAGLWLGGLLPLALAVRMLPLSASAAVCERFSPIGLGCVLVLAGTGFAQGLELIGSVPALLGTGYGLIALAKIGLFLLAVVLAACNRLWLTDRLANGAVASRRLLLLSVSVETAVGLAIIVAAAFLASTVPGIHEQPVWPLSWRFSLVTINEDADFRREVIVSALLMGAAGLLMVGALLWRRLRLVALVLLIAVVGWRESSLSLLTVEAYPTSFQTSPTGFAAASIVRGQGLFAANCSSCHGVDGTGNGPVATAARIRPADVTQAQTAQHRDGDLFWWVSHGIEDPEGGMAMPGFADRLSTDDRWALIDYLRAHAAGMAMRRQGQLDVPVRAPAMALGCEGLPATQMSDLAGRAVYIITMRSTPLLLPSRLGLTLTLTEDGQPSTGAMTCAAADPAAWGAYAILGGTTPQALAGTQFLIDPNGWLRMIGGPSRPKNWLTSEVLIAAVQTIDANPVAAIQEHHH